MNALDGRSQRVVGDARVLVVIVFTHRRQSERRRRVVAVDLDVTRRQHFGVGVTEPIDVRLKTERQWRTTQSLTHRRLGVDDTLDDHFFAEWGVDYSPREQQFGRVFTIKRLIKRFLTFVLDKTRRTISLDV